MAFSRPTLQEIITRVQADLVSRLSLAGPVLRRSVVYVVSRVIAGASHLLHGHLEWNARQILPDQSEAEFLTRAANLYGIARIAAAYAGGDVTFTGTDGATIPAGTLLQRADGTEYETDADGTIAAGSATVGVTAVVAGADGNADAGTALSMVSPIASVNASATVAAGGISGGTDAETDDALRVRLLERLRDPPHGGSDSDYVRWAKEVAGVTRVWVSPLELGLGTVVVRFVRDGDADIIPDAAEVAAVQDYIDERRPVTADVSVAAPVAVPLDFTISVVPDTAVVRAAVEANLEDLLTREAEPGGEILLSHIREAISVAAGESDHVLSDPVADVQANTGEIFVMGTVTWV